MNIQALQLHDLVPPSTRLSRQRIALLLTAALAVAGLASALCVVPVWQMLCATLPVLGLLPEWMR